MTKSTAPHIVPESLDETDLCTLDDLSAACSADADWIAALVDHGVIETIGQDKEHWRFTRLAIVRVAKAKRLTRDFSLSPPGVALVLDLLDEIEQLRLRGPGPRNRE